MATIQGPGTLKRDCSQEVWPITPEMLRDTNASWGEWREKETLYGTPSTVLPAFEVSVTPLYTERSSAAVMRVGLLTFFELVCVYQCVC